MAVYAAMVDRMDQGIGQVIESLEETGRLENTLILFLADNGGCAEGGTSFEKEGGRSGLSRQMKVTRDGKPVQFGNYDRIMPGPADTYQEYGKPWANASNTPFRLYKHFVHEGGIMTNYYVDNAKNSGVPLVQQTGNDATCDQTRCRKPLPRIS